jgi:predicted methyltransferase
MSSKHSRLSCFVQRTVLLSASAIAACSCGGSSVAAHAANSAVLDDDIQGKIARALAGDWRGAAARQRDVYRHPKETLAFFGLKRDMHVVEISPGTGWYTAVLAPVLAPSGQLTVTGRFDELAKRPDIFGRVEVTSPSQFGADGSADMVLTFRNMHNWVRDHSEQEVLARVFAVLKPGGIFGLVDHRAKADAVPPGAGGYLREDWVIAQVEKAGLRFVAKSEINANPRDTTDHPKGVWTLPPTYALGGVDRAKYEAIGESDRMTLRFVKP